MGEAGQPHEHGHAGVIHGGHAGAAPQLQGVQLRQVAGQVCKASLGQSHAARHVQEAEPPVDRQMTCSLVRDLHPGGALNSNPNP